MQKYIISILALLLLLSGSISAEYMLKVKRRAPSQIDRMPSKRVADMRKVPQNTAYYSKQIKPMSWSKQQSYDKQYNQKYFAPWSKREMGESVADMTWQIRMVQKRKIYDAKKRLIPQRKWQSWIENSNLENIDRVQRKAISITHANLRAFPTTTPAYRDPWKSTEGFPFDYNQNSELHINTPLYISHYSLDRKWAFVHASHAFGWVRFSDIALVTGSFIKDFKTSRYGITTVDDLALYRDGEYHSIIKLGTIFPLFRGKKWMLVAQKDDHSYAVAKRVLRPSSRLVAQKPLKFNSKNVARVAQEFYGEPYGWGGKLMTRDCSATTRDFFGCFGIYLARNSAKQAKAGKSINIKGLTKKAKKAAIIKHAKPFASMLYVPGHIGIYLGHYKSEPIIMHTYWGVRLNDWSKYTLARTIITTTEPGKELPQIREKSKLINTLQRIVNF